MSVKVLSVKPVQSCRVFHGKPGSTPHHLDIRVLPCLVISSQKARPTRVSLSEDFETSTRPPESPIGD